MTGIHGQRVICREPRRDEWFRVHPGDERRATTLALRRPGPDDTYLVIRELWPVLGQVLTPVSLRACTNLHGELFVWAIGLPALEGGTDVLLRSAAVIATLAETHWCRLSENPSGDGLIVSTGGATFPQPMWPFADFEEVIDQAFRHRVIVDLAHPVLRRGGGA